MLYEVYESLDLRICRLSPRKLLRGVLRDASAVEIMGLLGNLSESLLLLRFFDKPFCNSDM